jgi:hypothetical protein
MWTETVTLDPLPLTAFMIVLPSRRGVRKGAAFVFGWLVSLAIVVAITVVATGNNPPKPSTAPSLAALAVKIAIGAVLVGDLVLSRARRHRPGDAPVQAGRRRTDGGRYPYPQKRRSLGIQG